MISDMGLHRRGALVALVLGALSLTGCFRAYTDLTVHSDDTVSGTIVIAIEDDAAASLGMTPQELWEDLDSEVLADMPAAVGVDPYAEDGFTGARYTIDPQPLQYAGALAAGADTETFSFTREENEFVVRGVFDLTDPGEVPEDFWATSNVDLRLSITFPGEIWEATGEVNGTTVAWYPKVGEITEVYARADAGGSGTFGMFGTRVGSNLGWVLALAALVIAGVVVTVVLRSRRRADQMLAQPQAYYPNAPQQQGPGYSEWSHGYPHDPSNPQNS